MNEIQKIAKRRLESIEYSTKRILRKIEQNPARKADYEKRLAEFEVSKKALKLELKSGVAVKVKDAKQQALIAAMSEGDSVPEQKTGIVINVPAGSINMEGK